MKHLELTEAEAEALERLLRAAINDDRYFLSARVEAWRRILGKLRRAGTTSSFAGAEGLRAAEEGAISKERMRPMPADPELPRYTDAVLHDILRNANQHLQHVAFSARAAIWVAAASAVGSLTTAGVNLFKVIHGP